MIRHRAGRRRGYTLTVVLITLVLLFAVWSFTARTTSSLLRIETRRVLQQTRDQGPINAIAQALQLLQLGAPPDNTMTYTYQVSASSQSSAGSCTSATYVVVFTPRTDLGPYRWQVAVSPGTTSKVLPAPGANPQWP